MRLAQFQQRFQAAVLEPTLVVSDTELEIKTTPEAFPRKVHACSRHRIGIHHGHFWRRMQDFATHRYPLLSRLLGEQELGELVRRYISAYPPRTFVMSAVVEDLVAFLGNESPWAHAPILAQLAAFDFQRSGTRLKAEEPTVSAASLAGLAPEVLARMQLRLKRRSALTTTHFRFQLDQIRELPRDAKLDEQATYWLIYMTKRGCVTRRVAERYYMALQCAARGAALGDLFSELTSLGFTIAEIDTFVDRCLRNNLLVLASEGGQSGGDHAIQRPADIAS